MCLRPNIHHKGAIQSQQYCHSQNNYTFCKENHPTDYNHNIKFEVKCRVTFATIFAHITAYTTAVSKNARVHTIDKFTLSHQAGYRKSQKPNACLHNMVKTLCIFSRISYSSSVIRTNEKHEFPLLDHRVQYTQTTICCRCLIAAKERWHYTSTITPGLFLKYVTNGVV